MLGIANCSHNHRQSSGTIHRVDRPTTPLQLSFLADCVLKTKERERESEGLAIYKSCTWQESFNNKQIQYNGILMPRLPAAFSLAAALWSTLHKMSLRHEPFTSRSRSICHSSPSLHLPLALSLAWRRALSWRAHTHTLHRYRVTPSRASSQVFFASFFFFGFFSAADHLVFSAWPIISTSSKPCFLWPPATLWSQATDSPQSTLYRRVM